MKNPKVICLMPVKNEVTLLPTTLSIISQYCDLIIIADQMSTDGSREIYKNFEKVIVIDNKRDGHSNEVRWDLLKKAREYGNNNLILCLDADEYIPPTLFKKFLQEHEFTIGESFRFPWIQLWKSVNYFNNTGVWYRNYQRAAWVDDGQTKYREEFVINDHTSRIPEGFLPACKLIDIPIIHLQWTFWSRTQFKQAWYRCVELLKKPEEFISINSSYSHSLDCGETKLSKTPDEWTKEYQPTKDSSESWHKTEIFNLFNTYTIEFFEPLEIWHIPELEEEFIKRVGRKPVSVSENKFKKIIKSLKRWIIKMIHY